MSNDPGPVIHLKCALVVKGAFDRVVIPAWERLSGVRTRIDWAPTTVIQAALAAGETADMVLIVDSAVDELIAQRKAEADTRHVILSSRIGVAVRQGAPHPDISTLDTFKRAMIGARSVCYSRGGQSGVHFAPMLDRIGIAAAVNARATIIPAGFTAEMLVSGEADIAIQQLSELAVVPGIEIVGPLPDAVQKVTTFAVAVLAGSPHRAAAERFAAFLMSDTAVDAYRAAGLDPVGA